MIDRRGLLGVALALDLSLAVGFTAAAKGQDEPKVKSQKEVEGATLLAEMEDTLLTAPAIRLKGTSTASGAVAATFRGTLDMAKGNLMAVDFSGTFNKVEARAKLVSDGTKMAGGPAAKPIAGDTPAALNDSLIVFFARLGLMHNLANVAAGRPPETFDGKIREAITTTRATLREPVLVDGLTALPIAYNIAIGGKPVAEAVVYLGKTGLPLKREVTVHFTKEQGGDMKVVERYEEFQLGGAVDPARFAVGGGAGAK